MTTLVDAIFREMGELLIADPYMALLPALLFASVWLKTRMRPLLFAAAIWALYAVYEYLMRIKAFCPGECNIRIDLLMIYPALLIMSILISAAVGVRLIKERRE